MTKFDIDSVAIIGAGPGGLATLYEFLHTNQDGISTVGKVRATHPVFRKIVAFEQKDKAGGIWATSGNEVDLPIPPQNLLDTGSYTSPDIIHPSQSIPENLNQASVHQPFATDIDRSTSELEWKRSGVFPKMFTNIPSRFTRFSYLPNEEKYLDKSRIIYPFLTHKELSQRLVDFTEDEKLSQYVRVNSRVESLTKTNGKWVVTVRHTNIEKNKDEWYQEEFDAVVIANGHYTVPNIPHLPGLAKFNETHPGVLIHSKSYRSSKFFEGKKLLVVGGSISSVNLLQFVVPAAKETFISKRSPHLVFPWINKALESEGITTKPTIEKFIPETNEVLFTDGTREKDFDAILLATGYHFHYPFLNNYLNVIEPSNLSRVSGLYYNTFAIKDPTLATVGVAVSTINFHTIEASAAAIAGVWSNAKFLPPKNEQIKWEQVQIDSTANNLLFHYYTHDKVKEDFIDKLYVYAPDERYNPMEIDAQFLNDIDEGFAALENLFYKLKDGVLEITD
ncbi:FAD/NAD(P)-binding domain-containing protein [Nadsonia fulvescens var. elongata DSM 6958]|uniref:FAD/NAD(P)-binding domain-containing protein n=1 Tax=Nadsonia fulvescens var. elongata DSM 6958 TaxID=857566 RepID=A0A1E3PR13_9ASCO|nr:FAD/NAD(P)-binding domain-containing protein [Nadsonia fulvescens var. elongata DSM 6958]